MYPPIPLRKKSAKKRLFLAKKTLILALFDSFFQNFFGDFPLRVGAVNPPFPLRVSWQNDFLLRGQGGRGCPISGKKSAKWFQKGALSNLEKKIFRVHSSTHLLKSKSSNKVRIIQLSNHLFLFHNSPHLREGLDHTHSHIRTPRRKRIWKTKTSFPSISKLFVFFAK